MKYTRKDTQTNKILFLFVMAIGIGLIYLGFAKFYWAWNLITFPIGLMLLISGYKNYKRTNYVIQEIEFKKDTIRIKFLNGTEKEVKAKNLNYSLLVKKFHQPIRAVELIEKKKSGLFRGKSIGILPIAKWDKDIESIATYLIRNGFDRKKWKFGWSFGDFLMIFAIFLGTTEGIAESFIGEVGRNLSESIGEVGVIVSDEREKNINQNIDSEKVYLEKNKIKKNNVDTK